MSRSSKAINSFIIDTVTSIDAIRTEGQTCPRFLAGMFCRGHSRKPAFRDVVSATWQEYAWRQAIPALAMNTLACIRGQLDISANLGLPTNMSALEHGRALLC